MIALVFDYVGILRVAAKQEHRLKLGTKVGQRVAHPLQVTAQVDESLAGVFTDQLPNLLLVLQQADDHALCVEHHLCVEWELGAIPGELRAERGLNREQPFWSFARSELEHRVLVAIAYRERNDLDGA